MSGELEAVKRLRLKLKASKSLIRDLGIAVAQAEEALTQSCNAQPPQEAAQHEEHIRAA